eukprot:Filipodium_phascolosomae@DN1383_c0_g1_i1.p2
MQFHLVDPETHVNVKATVLPPFDEEKCSTGSERYYLCQMRHPEIDLGQSKIVHDFAKKLIELSPLTVELRPFFKTSAEPLHSHAPKSFTAAATITFLPLK